MAGDPNPNVLRGMGASMGITVMIAPAGAAEDGNVWSVVGN